MPMTTKHMNELTNEELKALSDKEQLIDVRTKEEVALGTIHNAINHPIKAIDTFDLPKDRTYYVFCKSGRRSARASEFLSDKGYEIINLDGGYLSYQDQHLSEETIDTDREKVKSNRKKVDYSGLQCPGPIVNISQELNQMKDGEQLDITVTDKGFVNDIKSYVYQTKHKAILLEEYDDYIHAIIEKKTTEDMEVVNLGNKTTIVLFSGDLDKAVAAMIIANGAKASGRDVSIFFTFWGLSALKKASKTKVKKKGIAKMFDMMLPKKAIQMPLSKMNMFGLGNKMMRYTMNSKNVDSLPTLLDTASNLGVKFIACTMSMDVMGISKEELRTDVEYGGVAMYIAETEHANHNLFI